MKPETLLALLAGAGILYLLGRSSPIMTEQLPGNLVMDAYGNSYDANQLTAADRARIQQGWTIGWDGRPSTPPGAVS